MTQSDARDNPHVSRLFRSNSAQRFVSALSNACWAIGYIALPDLEDLVVSDPDEEVMSVAVGVLEPHLERDLEILGAAG